MILLPKISTFPALFDKFQKIRNHTYVRRFENHENLNFDIFKYMYIIVLFVLRTPWRA